MKNMRSGASLGDGIGLARTFPLRLRGLLFRAPLADGEGLWIEPCNSVHTFFMAYPIDVAFLDDAGAILAMRTLPPWRLTKLHRGAQVALELPAGTLERSGTEVGDRLAFIGGAPHRR